MSTVKISQLPEISHLNANTDQTLVVGVDTQTGVTGKITVTTLAEGLYSNNALKVGENQIQASNVVAQFSGNSATFLQTLLQNFDANGSSDMVAMTSDSDNFTRFVDVGINGAEFADPAYSSMKPYDAYLFSIGQQYQSQTGNLVIGTGSTDADIVLIAGGTEEANIVGRIRKTSFDFYSNVVATGTIKTEGNYIFSDLSTQSVAAAPANYTQSAFNAANNAIANTILSQGTNTWQNTQITQVNQYAAASFAQSNTNSTAITQIQNVNSTQNTNITAVNGYAFSAYAFANTNANNIVLVNQYASGAYAKANAALANTTGTFAGSLTITNNLTTNGIVTIANSGFGAAESALRITASNTGIVQPPGGDGYVLHMTGKHNVPLRIVGDSFGANGQQTFVIFGGRAARGNVTHPSAVQTNDVLTRFSGSSYGTSQYQTGGAARIDIIATENHTDTSRGTAIKFYNILEGQNTLTQIATFNANNVTFSGAVIPTKGFIYTPNVISTGDSTLTIDFSRDSLIKCNSSTGLTVSFANYVVGKEVSVWFQNTSGSTQSVTHGCLANNSTIGATSFNLSAGTTAFMRYFSIDGGSSDVFVAITKP